MRLILFAALVLLPGLASAASMQFTVYNGFDETVAAFQRMALIMSDDTYMVLAASILGTAVVVGAIMFGAQGMAGQTANPMALLIPGAAGLAFFFGAVIPKGTVVVYDEVLNQSQAVGDIPDVVVFLAGGINVVQREMVRMIDTASATPYRDDPGSLTYALTLAASKALDTDADLQRSLSQFVMDCGFTAIGTGSNGATLNELLRGSPDLRDTLSKYTHPAWPTVWYPPPGTAVTGSCTDSWNYLKTRLDDTSSSSPVAQMKLAACLEIGLDVTNVNQNNVCDNLIGSAGQMFGSASTNSITFMRQFLIARSITNMLMRPDFIQAQGSLVNLRMMSEATGSSTAMNQWVPRLQAFMLAVVLGIVPIVLLFAVTPMVWKVAGLVAGMFVFLALWGVIDVAAVVMARDAAHSASMSLQANRFGYESIMMAPTAAVQALALYSKYRTMAMVLAGVISGALFKFSANAFSGRAYENLSEVAGKGAEAGRATMTPDGLQSTMGSMVTSTSASSQVVRSGFDAASSAAGHQGRVDAAGVDLRYTEQMAGGRLPDYDTFLDQSATLGVGGQLGRNEGAVRGAASRGEGLLDFSRGASTALELGKDLPALGRKDAAEKSRGPGGYESVLIQGGTGEVAEADNRKRNATLTRHGPGDGIEALTALARQGTANIEGALRANNGDTERSVKQFERDNLQGLARTEKLGDEGAKQVGISQANEELSSAQAQQHGLRAFGWRGLVQSKEAQLGKSAGEASVYASQGGAIQRGMEVGAQTGFSSLGNARTQQAIAESIFGPGAAARLQAAQAAAGATWSGVLEGAQLDNAINRTDMSKEAADAARTRGTAKVTLSFGADGRLPTISVDNGYTTQSGSWVDRKEGGSVREGHDRNVGDHVTAGDSLNIAQAMQFQGEGAYQTLLKGFGGNLAGRQLSDGDKDVLAATYAERMERRGMSGASSSSVTSSDTYTASAGAGLSAASGGPAELGAPGAGVSGDVSTSAQWLEQWQRGHDSRQNFVTTTMRSAIDQNWRSAQEQAVHQYGPEAGWDTRTREAANREVAAWFMGKNEASYERVEAQIFADTADQARRAQSPDSLGDRASNLKRGLVDTVHGWFD